MILHTPIPRRALAVGAIGLAGALLLSACASPAATESAATGEPVEGGTLVYLEHQPFTNLYPPAAGFYPNGAIINNVADRLVYQNPETLEFEPWVATSWEVNADATQYTFELRDDVTFSDGSPLDAEVVAKNFDLFGLGDADRSLTVSEAVNNYASSEVVDDDTVIFHFSAPAPGFLQATSTINSGLLSSETLDKNLEGFGAGSAQEIIGSGPFTVTAEELGSQLTLTAREDYDWAPESMDHSGRARIDTVQIVVTPESAVRAGSLVSGQGDVARVIEPQDEALVTSAGYTLDAPKTNGVNNALNLRFRNELLSDIRVRQAIVAAVDREGLVDALFGENYPIATSTIASTAPGYIDTSEYYVYDPEKAADLLDEAGWTLGADGVRSKDGVRLSLVASEASAQTRSFDTLTLVSQQLGEVGIEMTIMREGTGDYAAAILDSDRIQVQHSLVGRADMDVIKSQYYSTNRNIVLNLDREDSSIGDPKLEELLAAVASTPDPEARVLASQAAQQYIAEQAYVVPFYEDPQVYGIAPYIHDMSYESVARPSFYEVWTSK
ncbi:TIGR04028 family ABC transporter substrate-binding protein [Microbacterium allomyrinae]|uniref:TIGR04028 family ABC transporter substrate-binding protein n=1 Tax=Microbacterium allomyrinae TaxID=2830666 RepID=A0A9X1S340_9MICO|nr:TIGR04028 family ABC transporter substrate-binding protein [Microbacterium allomyrinae]MCC2031560.1 TIGR04028 family ABC transporter substrate-binding protein [Microbacterium allomyrinae]